MSRTGLRSLRIAFALLAVLAAGIRASAAQAPGAPESPKGPRATTIKGVQIERSGDVWIVKIEADGPLPAPKIGELDAPARVFLDFSGVRVNLSIRCPKNGIEKMTKAKKRKDPFNFMKQVLR